MVNFQTNLQNTYGVGVVRLGITSLRSGVGLRGAAKTNNREKTLNKF